MEHRLKWAAQDRRDGIKATCIAVLALITSAGLIFGAEGIEAYTGVESGDSELAGGLTLVLGLVAATIAGNFFTHSNKWASRAREE